MLLLRAHSLTLVLIPTLTPTLTPMTPIPTLTLVLVPTLIPILTPIPTPTLVLTLIPVVVILALTPILALTKEQPPLAQSQPLFLPLQLQQVMGKWLLRPTRQTQMRRFRS